jgi:hypothetical protein
MLSRVILPRCPLFKEYENMADYFFGHSQIEMNRIVAQAAVLRPITNLTVSHILRITASMNGASVA